MLCEVCELLSHYFQTFLVFLFSFLVIVFLLHLFSFWPWTVPILFCSCFRPACYRLFLNTSSHNTCIMFLWLYPYRQAHPGTNIHSLRSLQHKWSVFKFYCQILILIWGDIRNLVLIMLLYNSSRKCLCYRMLHICARILCTPIRKAILCLWKVTAWSI